MDGTPPPTPLPAGDPQHALGRLAALLRRRLEVIADHRWRDRDPAAHLDALKAVSEAIAASHGELRATGTLPARLDHFLTRSSYDKALAFIEEALPGAHS